MFKNQNVGLVNLKMMMFKMADQWNLFPFPDLLCQDHELIVGFNSFNNLFSFHGGGGGE